MKKTTLLVLMTFVIYNTNSQDFEAKAILGLTGSQIDGDDMAGYNKLGGTFGMGTNIYLSENISWQQEAVFYMRGAHASVQNASQKRAQMNYIDLNALLNYYFSESVFVQSGIGYGILMKAVSRSEVGLERNMITAHKGDINAQIGVGYKITEKIEGNVKMLYSILSTTTDAKWHNSLSAGLRFYL